MPALHGVEQGGEVVGKAGVGDELRHGLTDPSRGLDRVGVDRGGEVDGPVFKADRPEVAVPPARHHNLAVPRNTGSGRIYIRSRHHRPNAAAGAGPLLHGIPRLRRQRCEGGAAEAVGDDDDAGGDGGPVAEGDGVALRGVAAEPGDAGGDPLADLDAGPACRVEQGPVQGVAGERDAVPRRGRRRFTSGTGILPEFRQRRKHDTALPTLRADTGGTPPPP